MQILHHIQMGGGICNYEESSSPIINECTFISNSGVWGGGICNLHSTNPSIENCSFSLNTAQTSGGGIHNQSSSTTIINCSLNSNTAVFSGGGISNRVYNSYLKLINCILSSNSTTWYGGGLYNSGVPLSITNCTFTENSSIHYGGGIYNYNFIPYGSLNNCIVWDNSAGDSGNDFYFSNGSDVTLNYCCFSNDSNDVEGNGIPIINNCINDNPQFVDAATNDYRLYGESPCVNTGDNSYNSEPDDLRGEDRIQNTTIDMGAYEWTPGLDPGPVTSDLTLSGLSLESTDTRCYNAYATITLPGSGSTVEFQSGSSATLIAGQSVHFMPGFQAAAGSYVHAYITTDASFCDLGYPAPETVTVTEKSFTIMEDKTQSVFNSLAQGINVFPNPNNGHFSLDINNAPAESKVSIYNIHGSVIFECNFKNINHHEFDLPNHLKGMYFVKVISNGNQYVKKMVVN
ncbi:MAG: T9SS type A sorting domain-containing protein [Prolixibacteraceae bacterium]|nr:T9SS type A sorting domain-containing protein [Prolixibacteraceae bacterium]